MKWKDNIMDQVIINHVGLLKNYISDNFII